ncbi:hypothetical protein D3C84_1172250 [compost metagenome]
MVRKLESRSRIMSLINALLLSWNLVATSVRMEKVRSASWTDKVPSAEFFRPLNGNVSGPRWHWALMLMRPT